MTTNINELCEILKAYSEGKTIEAWYESYWYEANIAQWKFHEMLKQKLRIKPEPREIWLGEASYWFCNAVFSSKLAVEEAGFCPVKFREVLENE